MESKPRITIQIRLQSEKQKKLYQFMAKKKGLSLSEYFRQCADGSPGFTISEYEKEVVKAVYEIRRIGVNLNQIAKKYNENLYVAPRDEVLQAAKEVMEVSKRMVDFLMERRGKCRE